MTIQTVIYNKGSMILCTDLRQTVEENITIFIDTLKSISYGKLK